MAWANWVDVPARSAGQAQGSKLPTLQLASEVSREEHPAPREAPAPSASASRTSLPSAGGRCVSVGPFNDLARAARAAALLKEREFEPRQRAEQGESWEGFWVYVGGLKSSAEQS